jgi:hypothetical protein
MTRGAGHFTGDRKGLLDTVEGPALRIAVADVAVQTEQLRLGKMVDDARHAGGSDSLPDTLNAGERRHQIDPLPGKSRRRRIGDIMPGGLNRQPLRFEPLSRQR